MAQAGQPRRLRRRRRRARRFDLRGAALRPRRGREPRRRLHREADEGRAHAGAPRASSRRPASTAQSIRPSSGATARPASSTISTSTTPEPIDGRDAPHRTRAASRDLRRLHALRDPPRRGDRHLRHPRRRREAEAAAFRRPPLPRRLDQPLSARRLPREMRHRRRGSAPATPRSRSTSRSRSPSPA